MAPKEKKVLDILNKIPINVSVQATGVDVKIETPKTWITEQNALPFIKKILKVK